MKQNRKHVVRKSTTPPLVSVIVICYNHEESLERTLSSIFDQEYQNIELIISDDYSSDRTIEFAKDWVDKYGQRFTTTHILETEKNTGVSANCNRGVRKSSGDYIKIIAADDLLVSTYLTHMISGIGHNDIAFCYVCMFTNVVDLEKPIEQLDRAPGSLDTYKLRKRAAYRKQLVRNDFNAPAALIHRRVFKKIGFFDEKYPLMEDLPFWLRSVKKRLRIVFVDTLGVLYRRSQKSISFGVSPYADGSISITQQRFKEDFDRFHKIRRRKMLLNFMFRELYYSYGENLFKKILKNINSKNKVVKKILDCFVVVAPFACYARRNRRIDKRMQSRYDKKFKKIEKARRRLVELEHYFIQTKKAKIKYQNEKYERRRIEMFKLRSTPLSESDKAISRSIRQQYIYAMKKIKYEKSFISGMFYSFLYVRELALWKLDRVASDLKTSLISNSKFKSVSNLALLLSPIAVGKRMRYIFGPYNKKDRIIESEDSKNRKKRAKLKVRFKNDPTVSGDIESKKSWENYYNNEIALERAYQNRKVNKDKQVILFIAQFGFSFSAYESIIQEIQSKENMTAHLLIVPKKQPGMDSQFNYDNELINICRSLGLKFDLGYQNGEWISIYQYNPDIIFFQTPYVWQRPAIYSFDCRIAFPKIAYTPYGPWVMDRSVKDFISTGINVDFFRSAWRIFMDKLSLEMLQSVAPEYSEKAVFTGSPKVDFYRNINFDCSYCWKHNKNDNRIRFIWMPRWGVVGKRTSFPDYYPYFLQLIENNSIDFVLRPHPLLWDDLRSNGSISGDDLSYIETQFRTNKNSAIDEGADYRPGLLSTDILIMDYSSIVFEYLPTYKPVIYIKNDKTLLDSRIMNACYVVESHKELEYTINELMNGRDVMKDVRKRAVDELEFFSLDELPNASKIVEIISDESN